MAKCLPLATTVFISDPTGETREEEARPLLGPHRGRRKRLHLEEWLNHESGLEGEPLETGTVPNARRSPDLGHCCRRA